jgi:hypothetical protein
VTEVAGDFDVVIIAGDHLDLSSMVDFRAQSVVVRKYIAKLTAKTQLLVCSGKSRPRCERRNWREGVAVDSRGSGLRRAVRRRLAHFLRYPIHDLPHGGMGQRFAVRSKRYWQRTPKGGQGAGSGFITRHQPALPRAGTVPAIMETPISNDGSSNTGLTSSSAATCINRHSAKADHGRIA